MAWSISVLHITMPETPKRTAQAAYHENVGTCLLGMFLVVTP